jgi:hypothetical protein
LEDSVRISQREVRGMLSEDESLSTCMWFVAENYEEWDGHIFAIRRSRRAPRDFEPLEDPNLFLGFARLGARGEPAKSRILGWVRKHGLLTRHELRQERTLPNGEVNQSSITVEQFTAEVRWAYDALTLLQQIRAKDYETLRAEIVRKRKPTDVKVWHEGDHRPVGRRKVRKTQVYLKGVSVPRMVFPEGDLTDVEVIEQAAKGLEHIVGQRMQRISLGFTQHVNHPRSVSTIAGYLPYRPRLTPQCPDLLSAIWYQFAILMEGKRPLLTCEECGEPFFGRKGAKTCSGRCREAKSKRTRNGSV